MNPLSLPLSCYRVQKQNKTTRFELEIYGAHMEILSYSPHIINYSILVLELFQNNMNATVSLSDRINSLARYDSLGST